MPRGRARADSGRCGRGIAACATGAEGAADDGADGASMAGEVVAELIRIGKVARLEIAVATEAPLRRGRAPGMPRWCSRWCRRCPPEQHCPG